MSLDRRLVLAGGLAMTVGCTAAPTMAPSRLASTTVLPPRRVVSLNPFLDVILVEVADRSQIGALSHYARDTYGSTIADVARTLPFTYESAEEVLALRPDLVLTGRHSSLATRNALDRLNIPKALFGVPDAVAESLEQVREVARLNTREVLPLAVLEKPCRFREAATAALDAAGRRYRLAVETPNLSTLRAAVAAGLGITCRTPMFLTDADPISIGLPSLPDIACIVRGASEMSQPAARLFVLAKDACAALTSITVADSRRE